MSQELQVRGAALGEPFEAGMQQMQPLPHPGLEIIQEGIPLDKIGDPAAGADPQCDGKCGCRDVCNCQ
jgi:hypothetical protein